MYKKLDILLSAETTIDAWYDDGWIIAGEILSEFRSQDWVELARNVLTKPLAWQKKLAYCLDSNCSLYELHLLLLLQVEDEEVFAISIDTLRSFTDPIDYGSNLHDSKRLQDEVEESYGQYRGQDYILHEEVPFLTAELVQWCQMDLFLPQQ